MWLICSKRKFNIKKHFFYRDTTQHSFLSYRRPDHLHCTNRPFTHELRKDMSTPVILKVGGFAPLGAILRGKGSNKTKGR